MTAGRMTTMFLPIEAFLSDDDATARFGAQLATSLKPGDIVSLEGDLGAGKTAMARAILRALANDPALEVPSPTFAIIQPYDTPVGPVLHADLSARLAGRGFAARRLVEAGQRVPRHPAHLPVVRCADGPCHGRCGGLGLRQAGLLQWRGRRCRFGRHRDDGHLSGRRCRQVQIGARHGFGCCGL